MKKNIRNMRWHLAKKRWAKSRSEFFYDLRQNIKSAQKAFKHFFIKSKYEKNTSTKAPVYGVVAFIICSTLLFSIFKSFPYTWNKYKAYELHKKAVDYFDKKNISQAFWHAYTSYDYESGSKHKRYDNLKILANCAISLNHHESFEFLKELAHHKLSTIEDSKLYLKFSLDNDEFSNAIQHFSKVEHLLETDPFVKLLHLRIISRNWRRNYDEVLHISRELVHLHKLNDPSLNEIYLKISMREKRYAKEAVAYAYQLSQKNDESSIIAIRTAIQPLPYNELNSQQINSFLFDYLKHPLASKDDRLMGFTESFKRGLVPQNQLDEFINNQFQISEPTKLSLDELQKIKNFLLEINLPHKFISYIPYDVIKSHKLLLVDYLLVLMDLQKFSEVKELTQTGESNFTKAERHIIDALSRVKQARFGLLNSKHNHSIKFSGILGSNTVVSNLSADSFNDNNVTFFEYGYSSSGFKEFGLIDHLFDTIPHTVSLQNYLKEIIASGINSKINAQILLMKIYQENIEEDKMLKILNEIDIDDQNLFPKHFAYLLHLRTLYNVDFNNTILKLEELSSQNDTKSEMIIALSLAYYLLNKPYMALKTLEECRLNALFAKPGNQVIAAVIFDANNRNQDSRHFLSNLNIDTLLPPERKLVLRLLQTNNLNSGRL